MGGYGSGRRFYASPKNTVEGSLTLDAYYMQRHKLLGGWAYGVMEWKRGDKTTNSITYRVDSQGEDLVLSYTITKNETKRPIESHIRLTKTPANYGGYRYYLSCPHCFKRYSKLYLPPGAELFGCRKCYELTYSSCQDSHRFDRLFRQLGGPLGLSPAQVKRALEGHRK